MGLAVLAVVVSTNAFSGDVSATHQPADKMAVSGSAIEIMGASITSGGSSEVVTLAEGTIKTSGPTDLIFRVTAECALWTHTATIGNDISEAIAAVKVWVEVDGAVVPVSGDDVGEEAGKVVFCNRAYRMETTNFDDEDATIKSFLRTRSANAFNWITLDLGAGVHDVVLKAQLDAEVTGTAEAKAAVGKRTLIVEPVKLANDVVL